MVTVWFDSRGQEIKMGGWLLPGFYWSAPHLLPAQCWALSPPHSPCHIDLYPGCGPGLLSARGGSGGQAAAGAKGGRLHGKAVGTMVLLFDPVEERVSTVVVE